MCGHRGRFVLGFTRFGIVTHTRLASELGPCNVDVSADNTYISWPTKCECCWKEACAENMRKRQQMSRQMCEPVFTRILI